MLSYKNWKSLNESFFNQTLGLSNHQNLGLVSPSSLFDPVHSEAKAKKEVIEDESGDGETVPAASEKDDQVERLNDGLIADPFEDMYDNHFSNRSANGK